MIIITYWLELGSFISSIVGLIITVVLTVVLFFINKKIDDKKKEEENKRTDLIKSIDKNSNNLDKNTKEVAEVLRAIKDILIEKEKERKKEQLENSPIVVKTLEDQNKKYKEILEFKNSKSFQNIEDVDYKSKIISNKNVIKNNRDKTKAFLQKKKKII